MKMIIFAIIFNILLFANSSFAGPYWTGPLQGWRIYVNNGVVYLHADNMPGHCSYSRAQIDTAGVSGGFSQQNNKDLYAHLMVASSLGKQTLSIVVRSEDTVCSIYGAEAY